MASVMMTVNGINVHYEIINPRVEKTVVLLHGFTGSSATWNKVMHLLGEQVRIIAIDLMGHGYTDSPKNVAHYSMEKQVAVLHELLIQRNVDVFTLVGYSMGGRVALAYALQYPDTVEQLILESASPGLQMADERAARAKADNVLADRLESEGIQAFVDYWESIPLFATQKSLPLDAQKEIRAERLSQNARGLANSLRGMSTGQQNSYWDELTSFVKPVILVTGELDEKFQEKAADMKKSLPNCTHIIVPKVGHAIHVENPETFATIIKEQI
ncbi:2-succinyl-6-hydroxy-2,4-cyclohexadiene-1-carboxylate synthase [Viridibacillus sp. YIM B01967]|uniref:Putative 2-succinyl-6-hydroxy-2,4-cyclohexadiene-1-carboxylate synthase n=1 Tax=Viridibacillus soli TaxID=2798301 RepID=A0ABS1HAS9_9BACL|nr:2-succinyl-6-hydroxy-2,4-cyclohexadiene-1-carboxylate synthase [Viridibacillus soli]MBK3496113.1 2-succinyl-6-hydroxy-2,4-cyclohexadiene-1-carboxylate synthase [Viridibacillus soli]